MPCDGSHSVTGNGNSREFFSMVTAHSTVQIGYQQLSARLLDRHIWGSLDLAYQFFFHGQRLEKRLWNAVKCMVSPQREQLHRKKTTTGHPRTEIIVRSVNKTRILRISNNLYAIKRWIHFRERAFFSK